MILLQLFWTFFKIGLFTIGGGYSMISMIEREVIDNLGWLTQERLLDFIGVAESTPGPIALNLATFVGSSQAGVLGAICATAGVVMPSLVIILLIAIALQKYMQSAAVQGFFYGVRPVVVGLVLASVATLALAIVLPSVELKMLGGFSAEGFDPISLLLIAAMCAVGSIRVGKERKRMHPIMLILISAVLGILLFGVLDL